MNRSPKQLRPLAAILTMVALVMQTNNLASGLSLDTNDWSTVPASLQTNQLLLPIDPALPTEFYQLIYP